MLCLGCLRDICEGSQQLLVHADTHLGGGGSQRKLRPGSEDLPSRGHRTAGEDKALTFTREPTSRLGEAGTITCWHRETIIDTDTTPYRSENYVFANLRTAAFRQDLKGILLHLENEMNLSCEHATAAVALIRLRSYSQPQFG